MKLTLAQQFIAQALRITEEKSLAIAIAIVDSHGELVAFARQSECGLQSGVLAQSKAYTAARERQPSGNLGKWAKQTGKDMGYWTDSKITGFAGGLPIHSNQGVIGAIGISGLSEEDDESLARSILDAVLAD